jgi:fimbrial isopeptide formation D2 family protein
VPLTQPALAFSKTTNGKEVAPGDVLTYTITATDTGTAPYGSQGIPQASFTDSLTGVLGDASLISSSLNASTGTASVSGSDISWSGDLAAGQSATITYQVKVNSPDTGPHTLKNAVVSTSRGSKCPAAGAPSSCATTTPVGDVVVSKQVCGSTVAASCAAGGSGPWLPNTTVPTGGTAYWRITATNTGQVPLTGVKVNDALVTTCTAAAGAFALPVGGSMSVYCSSTNLTQNTTNSVSATYSVDGPSPGDPESNTASATANVAPAAPPAPVGPAPPPVTG